MISTLLETVKCRRCRAGLAVAAVLGAVVWHASLPAALGPAEGTAFTGAAQEDSSQRKAEGTASTPIRHTLRLATFNIHGCKGPDGRRDVQRTAECLENLDFVALQEVRGPWFWQQCDQAGELGRRLRLGWLFAPNTRFWYHHDSGNGLLSAVPVEFWQRIPLPRQGGRGYRNAVLVRVPHGGRTLHILATHVSRANEQERRQQLRTVIDLYLALSEPAVLLGDLNSDGNDSQLRQLLARPGVTDALHASAADKDRRRIDWIITRGLRGVAAGIRDNGASDHQLVWAEVE